jgi:hypothetical protein
MVPLIGHYLWNVGILIILVTGVADHKKDTCNFDYESCPPQEDKLLSVLIKD